MSADRKALFLLKDGAFYYGLSESCETAVLPALLRMGWCMSKTLLGISILTFLVLLTGCSTPLLYDAALRGDRKAVTELLDRGHDVNERHMGFTPLTAVAAGGNTEMVKLLLDRGAPINGTSGSSNFTPLMFAAFNGQAETAKILLERGADSERRSNDPLYVPYNNKTALQLAEMQGHTAIARVIMETKGETGLSSRMASTSSTSEGPTTAQSGGQATNLSVDAAKQRVAKAPLDWRSFNDLGIAYYREGLTDEAIAAFEQALSLHPVTTTIEAEQKQKRVVDSQRKAFEAEQARQQQAQSDATMDQMFGVLLGSIGSMPGMDARSLSMLSLTQGAVSAASQLQSAPPAIPFNQELPESTLKTKRELASIYENLGMAYRGKRDFSRAIAALEQALALDPSKTRLLEWIARCEFARTEYGKSILVMKRFLAITNVSPDSLLLISDAFQALGMEQEADRAFDASIRAFKKWIEKNPSAVAVRMALGNAYAKRHVHFNEAIDCFRGVLATDSSNQGALTGLANTYYTMSDYDQALKTLQGLKIQDVNRVNVPYAWYLYGRIYDAMGLTNDALTAFRKVVEAHEATSHKGSPPTYVMTAASVTGQVQAIRRLEHAVDNDPMGWDTSSDLQRLAFAYEKAGSDVEAIEALNRCLTINAQHANARKYLERITGKNARACQNALRASDTAFSKKDMNIAVQYLAKAYQLMPDGDRKRETQRKLLTIVGRMESVPPITEEGQRHFLRGNAALKSAKDSVDIDRAIAEYRWAIVHSPWIGNLYLHASVASGVRHRYSEAIEYVKLFLTACPAATNVETALNKLHELEYQQAQDTRSLSALSQFN
jgi:tetratricopeptide (TPR) repeat protein